jgi:hypothetical protein
MTTTGINPVQAMICPCCGHAVPATPSAPVVPLPTVGGGGGVGALDPNAVAPAVLAAAIIDTPDTLTAITGLPALPNNDRVQLEPVPVPIPLPDIPGGGWPTAVRPRTPAEIFGEPVFDFAEWGLLPPWLGTAIGGPPEPRNDTTIAGINFPLTTPLTQWP